MSHAVDTLFTGRFLHLDDGNVPVTGVLEDDYTTRQAVLTAADGEVQATVAIAVEEQASGWYGYTFTPTSVGTWVVDIRYSAVDPARYWSGALEVDAVTETDLTVISVIVEGVSLADIRLAVGSRIRDVLRLFATGVGSESVIVDATNLLDSDDAYVSSWGVVIDSAVPNEGHVFRVISSTQADGTLTIVPPLPEPLAEGDEVHLFCLMGKGFRPQFYDLEIGELVKEAYPDFMVHTTADIGDPFDSTTRRITIPEPITYVYEVAWERRADDWISLPPATWKADFARHEVVITRESTAAKLHGETIRISGLGRHPNVVHDGDLIAIDREYMVIACSARMAARRTTSREWVDNANRWERQADEIKAERSTLLPNNAEKVR